MGRIRPKDDEMEEFYRCMKGRLSDHQPVWLQLKFSGGEYIPAILKR